ncbi:uncharacterized protein LOC100890291 isoform X2 [Strongylocentrotus purpuratus]|uniref:THD domain-containing protein n=1 Tax=Strongylocentrotus purpuratus TaxID=7668 RepID=A0A7M7HKS4_STRPU|nr:uncharacterized protein LOC100890291 isoform X2 [Strongylocentrotus purpuratus]
MEAFNMNKSSPGFREKHTDGPCSVTPSLAHVLAVVTALMLIGTLIIYSLSTLRVHAALVAELQAEVTALRERVERLEALDTTQTKTKQNQNQDKNLKKLLMDFSKDQLKGKEVETADDDKDNSVTFLEKLFGRRELGSESDTQWATDRDNAGPGALEPEVLTEYKSQQMSEEEDDLFYPTDRSHETSLRHHIGKLSTNHQSERDDVRWESTSEDRAGKRTRRQAENRESRNRNRDRKASKGASKRNRGNRGSTRRREQETEETPQQNGGGESPPQPESAYVHFVGNVSSLVDTHPERLHPLSPRMVNISENLLSDWGYATWTLARQKEKFVLNNGVVTVKEAGIYFIYSQVQFFDDDRYMGHAITINEQPTFKCAESPPLRPRNMHTCYVGGLAYLHRDSRVAVHLAFSQRWVNMHSDSAYFGMYKAASFS